MSTVDIEDTIAAIASPLGPGLRGIVRISGPQTVNCIGGLFRADNGRPIAEYESTTRIDGQFELDADTGLPGQLLLWPTSRSYTRQPTAEFHTIGSAPLLQMALSRICESGARLAKPGEFTLRAFLSGRIDLTQAEAVLAVIDSGGQQQLNTALQQLAGGLAGPLGAIRDDLMGTLAELEAGLDFVEDDIEFISQAELRDQLAAVERQLQSITSQISTRDLVVDAVKVVLFGEPNSGKSSLFNALADSNQAIVTDVAGTTTDFVSAKLKVNSANIELVDTAGVESPSDYVGQRAQEQRTSQQNQALVKLFCLDATRGLSSWERNQLMATADSTVVVLTKVDLLQLESLTASDLANQIRLINFAGPIVLTSSHDLTGLSQLRDQIAMLVIESSHAGDSVVSSTVLRASDSLREAAGSVQLALEATDQNLGEELVAAEIRQALDGLGQVVGTVYTDDILDLVFGRFCIGK